MRGRQPAAQHMRRHIIHVAVQRRHQCAYHCGTEGTVVVILCTVQRAVQTGAHHARRVAAKEKDDSLDAIAVDDATGDVLQR